VSEEQRAQEGAGRGVRVLLERFDPGLAELMERAQESSGERRRTEPNQAIWGGDERRLWEARRWQGGALDGTTPARWTEHTDLFALDQRSLWNGEPLTARAQASTRLLLVGDVSVPATLDVRGGSEEARRTRCREGEQEEEEERSSEALVAALRDEDP